MNPFLEIIRPWNAIMAVIAVFLMAIISGNFTNDVLLACAVVFIVTGAGNVVNDYFDHKIDAVNKPERPIPSGRISLRAAAIYYFILSFLGIVLAFIIDWIPGIIALLSSVLMLFYAYSLKRKFIIGNVIISFLTGLTFVFGGLVVGEILISIYLGFYAFLMTMAREIVKDMEDVEGDLIEGATTLPIVHGKRISSMLAAFFMIFASFSSPILYFIGVFTILYLFVLSFAILVFLSSALSILKNQSVKNTRKISKRLKIGMGITFLAFAVGSLWITVLIISYLT